MAPPEQYFLLIYDVESRSVDVENLGPDHEAAADRYSALEEKHRDNHEIEVVLVGADSIETIKRTHSHYFVEQAEELFREFLETATR